MAYVVREIKKCDDGAVEKIIRSCLIEFGANDGGTAWEDPDLCRFSEIYVDEGNKYFVAEDENGQIVGGSGIGALSAAPGVCELQKMYCLPHVRGTGVADSLMSVCLDYAKEYYDTCYLETLDNMTRAMSFYEKWGFSRTDEKLAETGHYACEIKYVKHLN
jgi:putative acetyltransferase